jgi:hypothetical protein
MSDEEKYRTEPSRDDQSEKTGLLRPLPTSPTDIVLGKVHPVVKFLGVSLRESRRDFLVLFLIPFLVATIDTSVYVAVVIGMLEISPLYTFGVPAIAAITIGLTAPQMNRGLFGAILTALFFAIMFVVFLMSPALFVPGEDIGSFFVAGVSVTTVYFVLVIFASFIGCFIGIVIREFA